MCNHPHTILGNHAQHSSDESHDYLKCPISLFSIRNNTQLALTGLFYHVMLEIIGNEYGLSITV